MNNRDLKSMQISQNRTFKEIWRGSRKYKSKAALNNSVYEPVSVFSNTNLMAKLGQWFTRVSGWGTDSVLPC